METTLTATAGTEAADAAASDVDLYPADGAALPAQLPEPADFGPVRRIRIADLRPADSPRIDGERLDHVRVLMEAGGLPPILVHGRTMRVIDGMHRVRAALMLGQTAIEARFFEGSEELAFLIAVRANVTHGLALTLADRENAALRILMRHGQWSNRAVASVVGLAPGTVESIRRRHADLAPAPQARLGRDGRVRPLSTAEGRRLAGQVLAAKPEASLREVARIAGISTGTVRDVRRRLSRGEDPVPAQAEGEARSRREHRFPGRRRPAGRVPQKDRADIMRALTSDPSLRFTERGRDTLRWLGVRTEGPDGWEGVLDSVPEHCTYLIAELALWCADRWLELADKLQEHACDEQDAIAS
jgi:ParB-like nuclease domain